MLICISKLLYFEIVYFREWYEFHKKQGVDLFYIYVKFLKGKKDNNIFEDLKNKYKNYDDIFFLHINNGRHIGIKSFLNNNYEKYKNDWLLYIDIDEFCYSPLKDKKITDIIELYEKEKKYAIGINWKMFGSNDLENNANYKTIDNFTKCAEKDSQFNLSIKSLVKIKILDKNVKKYNPHRFKLLNNYKYYSSNMELFKNKNKKNFNNFSNKLTFIFNFYLVKWKYNIKHLLDSSWLFIKKDENPNLIINHYSLRSKSEYEKKIFEYKELNKPIYYNLNIFERLNKYFNKEENLDILEKL